MRATIPLRHLADVNPPTAEFSRLSDSDYVTFAPLETVWADGHADFSRRRPKSEVSTGYTRFRTGDVLVPKVTPTFQAGRVAVADLDTSAGAGTTELHIIRAREGVSDPRFLAYVCRSVPFLAEGVSAFQGVAGLQRVPEEFLRSFPITILTLGEQRRIADFLDTETAQMDRLDELRVRQLRLLTEQHESTLTALVEGSVGFCESQTRRLKFTGARVTVGIVVTPAAWYVEAEGVPAIRGLDVSPGAIRSTDLVQISREGHLANLKSELRSGDLVVVRTGNAGAACVVPPELDRVNAIDLLIVRPGPGLIPKFLEHMINSERTRKFVDEFSVGTIQSHFNVATLSELPIPTFDLDHQAHLVNQIDKLISRHVDLVAAITAQRAALRERRQALITAAVTGQLEITTASGWIR